MAAADAELELEFASSVGEFFARFADNDRLVERIDGCNLCEDGMTVMLVATLRDGGDCYVSVTPGEPIIVQYTEAPPPTPKPRHLFAVRCEPVT